MSNKPNQTEAVVHKEAFDHTTEYLVRLVDAVLGESVSHETPMDECCDMAIMRVGKLETEIKRLRKENKQAYDIAHKYRNMYSALSIPAYYLIGFTLNDAGLNDVGPSDKKTFLLWTAKIREKVQDIQDAITAFQEAEAAKGFEPTKIRKLRDEQV
jgi:hypothetical protein